MTSRTWSASGCCSRSSPSLFQAMCPSSRSFGFWGLVLAKAGDRLLFLSNSWTRYRRGKWTDFQYSFGSWLKVWSDAMLQSIVMNLNAYIIRYNLIHHRLFSPSNVRLSTKPDHQTRQCKGHQVVFLAIHMWQLSVLHCLQRTHGSLGLKLDHVFNLKHCEHPKFKFQWSLFLYR